MTRKNLLPVNDLGFYGEFGGAFVPDALKNNLKELADAYYRLIDDADFNAEFRALLRDYVGRPSPLFRAANLSKRYGTNVYLKREDLNHTGAHKINNALGMALLARYMGKKRIIAETGAGQHGVAAATVCALMGMDCTVYMGAMDVARQKPNVERMKMLGAKVVAVEAGGRGLTEAVDAALMDFCEHPEETFYLIGSAVGPHPYPEIVATFQSVISEELLTQVPELTDKKLPDYVIACVGGGSNASGAFYHFLDQPSVKLIAVEAAGKGIESGRHAATMTVGKHVTLHGMSTLSIVDENGKVMEPYSVSAGLDYPGVSPLQAYLAKTGRTQVLSATDEEALEAAFLLARTEGIIPAIESAHALAGLEKIKFDKDDVVVVNVSGRGDKDMGTYLAYAQERRKS